MAMPNEDESYILLMQIRSLITLLVKIDNGDACVGSLTEQKQKILDMLPVTTDDGSYDERNPLFELLSCPWLRKTAIPLDVLEQLIVSGFDVNHRHYRSYDSGLFGDWISCLKIAVDHQHYDAARCLVKHGANCDISAKKPGTSQSTRYEITPLASLADDKNAPLDLFDLLATPRSLTDTGDGIYMPLEIALMRGNTEGALRLIKLGAPLVGADSDTTHLIHYCLKCFSSVNFDELLIRLIPSKTIAILSCIDWILESEIDGEIPGNARALMLRRLFQYIKPAGHMCIRFGKSDGFLDSDGYYMAMNGQPFCEGYVVRFYWWSLHLVYIGWPFESTPQSIVPMLLESASVEDVQYAHKIDDIWNTYRQTVTSLQNLCIQQTRRSMRDFSEESFISLPVPVRVRHLLMHQNLAEIAFEQSTIE